MKEKPINSTFLWTAFFLIVFFGLVVMEYLDETKPLLNEKRFSDNCPKNSFIFGLNNDNSFLCDLKTQRNDFVFPECAENETLFGFNDDGSIQCKK